MILVPFAEIPDATATTALRPFRRPTDARHCQLKDSRRLISAPMTWQSVAGWS